MVVVALLLAAGCIESGTSARAAEEQASGFGFEITRDWRPLSIGLSLFMVLLIALAYLAGQGFDMPEIRAWAGIELVQVVVTLIIIISWAAVLTLLDSTIAYAVSYSNLGYTCEALENCAISTAQRYIEGLVDLAMDSVKETADNAVYKAWLSSLRIGSGCNEAFQPPCLQFYFSFGIPTKMESIMEVEYYTRIVDFSAGLISILSSQLFFIREISFKVAPVLLLLGIVGRSFFVTRRLGGLLMAVGLGVMFVLPAMYVLDWVTLSVTLYGDKVLSPANTGCPDSCQAKPPLYYTLAQTKVGEGYVDAQAVSKGLEITLQDADYPVLDDLAAGRISYATIGGTTLYSCEARAKLPGDFNIPGSGGYCPRLCRELPIPLGQECTAQGNDTLKGLCAVRDMNTAYQAPVAGDTLPGDICELARQGTANAKEACYKTPEACRIMRVVAPNEGDAPPVCPAICRTVLPLKTTCSKACLDARDYCRVATKKLVGGAPQLVGIQERVDLGYANGGLPAECVQAVACDQPSDLDAYKSCVYIQPDASVLPQCDVCIFGKREDTTIPSARTDCASLCDASPKGPPKVSTTQFVRATREGMAGGEEVKTVAALILPAYILPLLNIVVTLMFIRTFAPILGGDIDIPGVSRLL